MDYRQLLDPRAAAKEKSKSKSKDLSHKYGPTQSRKGTGSVDAEPKLSPVKFDAKALLAPKAAAAKSKSTSSIGEASNDDSSAKMADLALDSEPGMGALIERQYNLENREAPISRKRKSEAVDDTRSGGEEQKSAKTAFTSAKSGGSLGEYLKEERKKGAQESGPSADTIDLTNEVEGEEGEDDDVVFISESNTEDDNREVCLGRLHSQAMVWEIPQVPKYQMGKMGKDFWPQSRIDFKRTMAKNNIIELTAKSTPTGSPRRIGNMHLNVASVLCPLLDGVNVNKMRLKIFLEAFRKNPGEFPGARTSRSLNISIIIYSPRSKADMIGRFLSQGRLFLEDLPYIRENTKYYNPHKPKVLGEPMKSTIHKPQSSKPASVLSRTQEEILRETTNMFDSLVKSEELPEKEANRSVVETDLLSHQKQALHFMTQHELAHQDVPAADSGKGPEATSNFSLWKRRITNKGEAWYNVITSQEVSRKPEPARGGILADVMGMGKSLSMLSLISETLEEARAFGDEDAPIDSVELKSNSKATLIICPKSVMSTWEEQIRTHTKAGKLKVYAYHGTNRTQDLDELSAYDIVLAPYQTVAAEFSDGRAKRDAIASTHWFRVVLDEAHQIRNPNTAVSKACCKLSAQRRWAVTGTPVQNRLDDLGALIKFLRIKPFDDGTSWSQHIIAPFRSADANVITNLRLLVDSITLRRSKEKLGMADRTQQRQRLQFSDEEMAIYSQFSKQSNMQLRLMLSDNNRLRGKSYAHVLKSLSRLRAICAHGREMLNEEDLKELEGLTAGTAIDLGDEPTPEPDESFISEKHAYETFDMMCDSETNVCAGCGRKVGDRKDSGDADVAELSTESDSDSDEVLCYLTPCFHLLCKDCDDSFIEVAKANLTADQYHECPYCEQYVRWGHFELTRDGLNNMLLAREKKKKNAAKWDENTYSGPHTKVKYLLNALQQSREESAKLPASEPPIRSVVFSGWTTYLDLIEHALDEHEIAYVRLDGTMSVKKRSAVLKTFSTDDSVTVLLVSIKAGGQGLNFTAANKVYMMEPQFNPGVETQAIDRVHRLGQKRDVQIVHYIMKDSVEEKILTLQKKKEDLAKLSMEKKMSRGEEAKKRIEELRELFK